MHINKDIYIKRFSYFVVSNPETNNHTYTRIFILAFSILQNYFRHLIFRFILMYSFSYKYK